MGMTIDELIENLTTIRNKICPGKYETETSLTFEQTLNIMRKYQKIKEQVDIAIDKENFAISGARLIQIREIIHGNVD